MASVLSFSQRARLGAMRRYQLYGNPGTFEGRSKGGKSACEFFRLHPELAKKSSFVIRKKTKQPVRSRELAELFGILLGDGGIRSKYQLTVSFNHKTDRDYSRYVARLIKCLFAVDHKILLRKVSLGADIVISSRSVIEFLLEQGLKEGSKVRNQVDIPGWIKSNIEFRKACLRGLFDTDGSIYRHEYEVKKKKYGYWKMNFTNRSHPLLNSVLEIIRGLGIKAFLNGDNVYIHSKDGVKRYFEIVGSSNPKFLAKF